jgi:hypothetical protein
MWCPGAPRVQTDRKKRFSRFAGDLWCLNWLASTEMMFYEFSLSNSLPPVMAPCRSQESGRPCRRASALRCTRKLGGHGSNRGCVPTARVGCGSAGRSHAAGPCDASELAVAVRLEATSAGGPGTRVPVGQLCTTAHTSITAREMQICWQRACNAHGPRLASVRWMDGCPNTCVRSPRLNS